MWEGPDGRGSYPLARPPVPRSGLLQLDFFRKNSGATLRYLAFDSRVTTDANVSRLNRDGLLFVAVRRRGKRLLHKARDIAP